MDYQSPLIGGILIGLGSILALAASGKVPGISGIVARVLRPKQDDVGWRIVFLAGLILGGGLLYLTDWGWQHFAVPDGRSLLVYAIAGLLVGFGTRMGGGCTSGHGVCGLGSGARDSVVYTLVFMATGAITVFVFRILLQGGSAA